MNEFSPDDGNKHGDENIASPEQPKSSENLAHLRSLEGSALPTIDKTFTYLLWRGLVAILWIHYSYRMWIQLLTSPPEARGVDFPVLPFYRLRRLRVRIRVEKGDKEDKICVSLPYRILEKGQIVLPSKASETARQWLTVMTLAAFFQILFTILLLPVYFGWALIRAVPTSLRLALSKTPLVLAILVVIFTTGDAWRLFGNESGVGFAAIMVIIVGLGVLAIVRVASQGISSWKDTIWQSDEYAALAKQVKKAFVNTLVNANLKVPSDLREGPAWTQRLKINVYALFWFMVVSHLIAIARWIAFIFIFLGFIAVNSTATKSLLGSESPSPVIIWQTHQLGQTFTLTRQLVLLSVTLGAVAVLTFSTLGLQDQSDQKKFVDDCQAGLQKSLAVLAYYMAGFNGIMAELGILKEAATSGKPDQRASADVKVNQPPGNNDEQKVSD